MRALVVFLLLPTAVVFSAESTDKIADLPRLIDAYAAASRAERQQAIIASYRQVEAIKRDRKLSKDDRENQLATVALRISELEDPAKPYYAVARFDITKAKAGDIGSFRDEAVPVLQVVDRKNAILDIQWSERVMTGVRNVDTTQVPVYGRTHHTSEMWLTNYPTTGMVDGRAVRLNGVFAITGTKKYETDDGPNTVPLLEQLDMKPYEAKFTRMDDSRTWTSVGGHTTEAIFVRYKGGNVELLKPDGKSLSIPLEKFSEDDRKFVRDWLKAAKAK